MSKAKLGATVRDKITGFEGIVMGRVEYLTGCDQLLVQPKVKGADKEFVDSKWLDEPRVEVLDVEPLTLDVPAGSEGADKPAPSK